MTTLFSVSDLKLLCSWACLFFLVLKLYPIIQAHLQRSGAGTDRSPLSCGWGLAALCYLQYSIEALVLAQQSILAQVKMGV